MQILKICITIINAKSPGKLNIRIPEQTEHWLWSWKVPIQILALPPTSFVNVGKLLNFSKF